MDAYPEDSVDHNLPLILLSGLEAVAENVPDPNSLEYPSLLEKGAQIESDFPALSGAVAEELRQIFLEEDASHAPWHSRTSSGAGLRLKSVGRVGVYLNRLSDLGSVLDRPLDSSESPLLTSPDSPTDYPRARRDPRQYRHQPAHLQASSMDQVPGSLSRFILPSRR